MALECPHCGGQMQEVKARATLGYLLALDQCSRCGGIWCDRFEALPLASAEADRLEGLDVTALHAPVPQAAEPLRCPRCRARMRPFHDPSLPPDARVERCLNCEGMWFNRGELRRLKHLHNTASPVTVAPNGQPVESTVGTRPACADPPTIDRLDDAFRPLDAAATPEAIGTELLTSAAWLAARAALHLLLHI